MSAKRIDPETRAAVAEAIEARIVGEWDIEELAEAALRAADEKRHELTDPEGQEYAYQVHTQLYADEKAALQRARYLTAVLRHHDPDAEPIVVERALLGDWERV